MTTKLLQLLRVAFLMVTAVATVRAQQPVDNQKPNAPSVAPSAQSGSQKKEDIDSTRIMDVDLVPPIHRFWDRENDLLFAGVGAGRALDYASTLNLRRRDIDEIFLTNSIVDNHPLFGGIEAAATAASIGVSYLFHRTGHHRLERWTSAVHFGVAVGGAIRNYALKTPHPN